MGTPLRSGRPPEVRDSLVKHLPSLEIMLALHVTANGSSENWLPHISLQTLL